MQVLLLVSDIFSTFPSPSAHCSQDPLHQYPGYVTYAAANPYHQLVNDSVIGSANRSLTREGGCLDQVRFNKDDDCAAIDLCEDRCLLR